MTTTNPGDCRPDGIISVRRYDVTLPTISTAQSGVDRTSPAWKAAYEDALRGEPKPAPKPAPKVDAPFSVQTVADQVFAKSWKRQPVNDESEEAEVDISADLFRSSFSSTVHERAFK